MEGENLMKKSPSRYAMRVGMQGSPPAWVAAAMPAVEGGGKHRMARSAHMTCPRPPNTWRRPVG